MNVIPLADLQKAYNWAVWEHSVSINYGQWLDVECLSTIIRVLELRMHEGNS